MGGCRLRIRHSLMLLRYSGKRMMIYTRILRL